MKKPSLRYWWMWLLVVFAALLIQLVTIDVLPHLQQDEAQITDYGRLAFDPYSNWSATWVVEKNKPLLIWTYIGPLLAEASFLVGGASGIGPRIIALLGGIFAAAMAFGWLRARKVPDYAAWGLSLAFLLDPLFVLSQRIGRVDCWVFALCLAACWVLRSSALHWNRFPNLRIVAAAVLAATAALVWASSLFLYPLIALELWYLLKKEYKSGFGWKPVAIQVFLFLFTGLFTVFLLLIPIWQNVLLIFSDMSDMISQNVEATKSFQDRIAEIFYFQPWMKVVKVFVKTFSPIFPLLALAGAIYRAEKGLLLVTVSTLLFILLTLIYEFRVLYLLPYFLALSSGIFQRIGEVPFKVGTKAHRVALSGLFILVFWSVTTSLIIRTAYGMSAKEELSRNRIRETANSFIGAGNYKVFLAFTYEFYFAGRSLGWELFIPYMKYEYDNSGNWVRNNNFQSEEGFLAFLSEMDYAVFPQDAVTDDIAKQLSKSGLHYRTSVDMSDKTGSSDKLQEQNRNMEIFLYFLRGKEDYGSYLIFSRENRQITNQGI